MNVAHALVTGLLREEEVSAEVREAIGNAIALYRLQGAEALTRDEDEGA